MSDDTSTNYEAAQAPQETAASAAPSATAQTDSAAASVMKDASLLDSAMSEQGHEPVPPTYENFKLPPGVTIDADSLKQAHTLFAAAKLPQEQAQKFVDLAVSREQAAAQRGVQTFVDLQNQWISAVKADPEIGGAKFAASVAQAARAIDRLGVPGLKDALNLTGAGNHPAVVKAFVRLGQMVSEDRFRPGRQSAPSTPRSPAEVKP